ncbi:transcriptional regulator [Paenisporosarcina antarctica]|uniref:Transcriptional regulator n=1 Tax=Paenisporosarcina antarctica TaxID=417367 RepID=A0A4P6ZTC4_9BACL|nr:transcriptional regulator [Paenisporosarcina antarctica]QBP39700.1 transcriptional regulator [Paenisporosarcina antarctica]
MKDTIIKYMQRQNSVEMIYLARDGNITKRRVKVIKACEDTFQAYCFTKKAKRTFYFDHVLAVVPVIRREREDVIS